MSTRVTCIFCLWNGAYSLIGFLHASMDLMVTDHTNTDINTEAETQWMPFPRQHIQTSFLLWKCMKLRFHWSLFLMVQLTIFQHWFRWWLGTDWVTSHCLNQWWLIYWRIYASFGLNELRNLSLDNLKGKLQMTFSNAFPSMEMFKFWLKFFWSLLLRVKFKISQHWLR